MSTHLTVTGITCAAALCLFAGGAYAADPGKTDRENQYKATVARADADYTAAKDACKQSEGRDKGVCLQEAKAAHTKAVADAKAVRTAQSAMAEAREDTMEAD